MDKQHRTHHLLNLVDRLALLVAGGTAT